MTERKEGASRHLSPEDVSAAYGEIWGLQQMLEAVSEMLEDCGRVTVSAHKLAAVFSMAAEKAKAAVGALS